ncbi:Quinoprotein glucose dehydrogenase B precursor [Rubripirellula tenax]|uniref:Quinoprotein glucose dehydrogenase B n=1 Tax=Rubripirellula tenax TaxID=2528015 RepID=A0A5C6FE26_9BACT|nr:PQQ-dependent sugar dehydrogenase [Rubripirellula tenax]TWU59002.1 Quinoprotein glucose dehydrogenase B precursor [Rubripirellula tenax]
MSIRFLIASAMSCFWASSFATAAVTARIETYATIPGGNARMNTMTSDPAGRLFVNEQNGGLFTVDRATRNVSTYLNLADSTQYPQIGLTSSGERGFQSFAFHPDFYNPAAAGFGKLYTIHSSTNTSVTPDFDPGDSTAFHTVLLEWNTSNPTAATFQPASVGTPFREVARFKQPYFNHNAGQLAFNTSVGPGDPDRNNLYIGMGDGGSGNDPQDNGQNPGNPYGAVLRIDPLGNNSDNGQYGLVADNVFASDGDATTIGEVFAYGLRNPQRFGWDDLAGDMYIADIGQNSFEEINVGVNGGNFGWDIREGSQGGTLAGAIDPAAEYAHDGFLANPITGSVAITVGDVVRGSEIFDLNGKLLLGDFPNGIIYTLDVDNDPLGGGSAGLSELILVDENGQTVRLIDLIRGTPGNTTANRADLRFSYGIDGEVFILNKRDNVIRRLAVAVPEPTSLAMVAVVAAVFTLRRRRR